MASSVPAAVDWLVARLRELPELRTPVPVVVADGWPSQRADTMVVVGITPESGDSTATLAYAELSDLDTETVELPLSVFVRRAGPSAASEARREAMRLLDEVRALIAADRRLGGAVRPGLPARLSSWTMTQTVNVRQAGEGRVCEVDARITWQHRG